MSYRIVKFRFSSPFRFGRNFIDNCETGFTADTFFSALYIEALKSGKSEELYRYVQNGTLLFSDAFPWYGKTLCLPKPLSAGETERQAYGSSVKKKKLKKLKYISVDDFDSYLGGTFSIENYSDPVASHIRQYLKVNAAVRGNEETLPYRIRLCEFSGTSGAGAYNSADNTCSAGYSSGTAACDKAERKTGDSAKESDEAEAGFCSFDSGLYIIVKCSEGSAEEMFRELLSYLSFSGIGGKRSSGCGRFKFEILDAPVPLAARLDSTRGKVMSLSISLPEDSELEKALEGGAYTVVKRSGFIASETFASQQMKKKDLYMLKSGSCFNTTFRGSVRNVACRGGSHPVFRYGKPIFLGIDS